MPFTLLHATFIENTEANIIHGIYMMFCGSKVNKEKIIPLAPNEFIITAELKPSVNPFIKSITKISGIPTIVIPNIYIAPIIKTLFFIPCKSRYLLSIAVLPNSFTKLNK